MCTNGAFGNKGSKLKSYCCILNKDRGKERTPCLDCMLLAKWTTELLDRRFHRRTWRFLLAAFSRLEQEWLPGWKAVRLLGFWDE